MKAASDISIRSYWLPGDLGQVIRLHGELYAREYGLDVSFEAFVALELSQFALRKKEREGVWLIERAGQIHGSVAVVEEHPQLARLRWYILHPDLRGQGWAAQLLDLAVGFARRQGYPEMMLFTLNELSAAKRRYEAAGFYLHSQEEKQLWGKTVLEEIYYKTL